MPYLLQWKRPGFESKFSGSFTGQEMHDCVAAVTRHPHFDDHRYHICDFREVTSLAITDQSIIDSCALLIGSSFTNANVLVVAVATQDFMQTFLDRFVALGISPFPIKRFATRSDAETWVFATLGRARSRTPAFTTNAPAARFRAQRR